MQMLISLKYSEHKSSILAPFFFHNFNTKSDQIKYYIAIFQKKYVVNNFKNLYFNITYEELSFRRIVTFGNFVKQLNKISTT